MIGSSVRELCMMSVFCGAAMSLSPKGSVRNIMNVLCTAVLILCIAGSLGEMDFSVFALESARLRENEAELCLRGEEISGRLNRLVIQEQCGAYILDKAAELELELGGVGVEARWSSEGLWVPYSVSLSCSGEEGKCSLLRQSIEAELGIPGERQYWTK